jgi:hypothetical protein
MRIHPWLLSATLATGLTWGVSSVAQAAPIPVSLPLIRAQQLLARLGYLPLHWRPLATDAHVTLKEAWNAPPKGTWTWRRDPEYLRRLWATPGVATVVTRGALMSFQRVQGLDETGSLNPATEHALDEAWLHRDRDPHGYNYALVDEYQGSTHPETLTLWHNGKVVLKSLANTGIEQAQTPLGTYPVYLHYYSQTMSGTTPWGTYYDDPGVPYVNYINGGVAVHGFPRAAYGFPQSLGCIELPIPNAAIAWLYLHIGTLVTIVANAPKGSTTVIPAT